jgi:hypothetical protein
MFLIRISIGNTDPDSGAMKLAKVYVFFILILIPELSRKNYFKKVNFRIRNQSGAEHYDRKG